MGRKGPGGKTKNSSDISVELATTLQHAQQIKFLAE